ncbi:MAG: helix-turn-helix transcriptional regulator [Oscillospiraceae bacterium]|nr:helix-turn-helix transcriptional regulator [Oscillospiraceae bacterium]
MNIHESIRYHRRKLELTQAQLAQQVGVTVQAVSKWETGSGMPDTAQLVPLARALRISTDTLLSFEDRTQAFKARGNTPCGIGRVLRTW